MSHSQCVCVCVYVSIHIDSCDSVQGICLQGRALCLARAIVQPQQLCHSTSLCYDITALSVCVRMCETVCRLGSAHFGSAVILVLMMHSWMSGQAGLCCHPAVM